MTWRVYEFGTGEWRELEETQERIKQSMDSWRKLPYQQYIVIDQEGLMMVDRYGPLVLFIDDRLLL